jgi:hypothetical protein
MQISQIAGFFDDPHELLPIDQAVIVLIGLCHHPPALLFLFPQLLSHPLQIRQSYLSLAHLVVKLKGLPELLLLVAKILD